MEATETLRDLAQFVAESIAQRAFDRCRRRVWGRKLRLSRSELRAILAAGCSIYEAMRSRKGGVG
jgi:hypothetical protein